MKTTVKLNLHESVSVEPTLEGGGIWFQMVRANDQATKTVTSIYFTPDQWGALMFGSDQIFEALDLAKLREVCRA